MKKKLGNITLVVTLILFGCILLVKNFTTFNIKPLLSILWPSIIILFGLELVLGRLIIERKEKDVKISVNRLSVVIIVIVIVITALASSTGIFTSRLNGINIFGLNDMFYSQSSTYRFNYEYDAEDITKVYLDNNFGNVDLKKISGDQIRVKAEISINHNDEEYADEVSNEIVDIDVDMDSLNIRSNNRQNTFGNKIGSIEVSYIVEIPNEIDIEISNSYGNISVEACAKQVDINSKHTNISVRNISGNLSIENSYGDVNVEEIKGTVEIFNKHGKIDVNQVSNDIKIENSYDQVKVADIEGNVEIINSHDLIDVKNISGNIEVESQYSDIRIEGVKQDVKILNRHGNVRLDSDGAIEKSVNIQNEYGDVTLIIPENQEGRFKAYVKYGDIYNDFGLAKIESGREKSLMDIIGNSNVTFEFEIRHGNLNINNSNFTE